MVGETFFCMKLFSCSFIQVIFPELDQILTVSIFPPTRGPQLEERTPDQIKVGQNLHWVKVQGLVLVQDLEDQEEDQDQLEMQLVEDQDPVLVEDHQDPDLVLVEAQQDQDLVEVHLHLDQVLVEGQQVQDPVLVEVQQVQDQLLVEVHQDQDPVLEELRQDPDLGLVEVQQDQDPAPILEEAQAHRTHQRPMNQTILVSLRGSEKLESIFQFTTE